MTVSKKQQEPKKQGRIRKILNVLGPGLITGASDDDPSGIATYSQAGAQFGYSTLWTALLSFPLMAAVQGMCARIGIITAQGLTVTLRQHYPKAVLYLMLLFSFPAITLNIGADIQSMGAVAHMLIPSVSPVVFCVALTIVLMLVIIKFPYQKIAMILKWLCISLLLYIAVPFMVHQNWWVVLKHTVVPDIQMNKEFISILVALLGTTISPYLFFWQATMEAEDIKHKKQKLVVDKQVLTEMKLDVNFGMLFSNLVMFFIILTAAAVLFKAGKHSISTVEEAAAALQPLAGKLTYWLFGIGVLGTGLLAIPVLAGSQSYMLAETFGWKAGLDKTFPQAKGFYISIIFSLLVGLGLNFIGITPIQALLYTAILYGLTAPVLIAIILHIGNNKKIMKSRTNSKLSNILGGLTLLLMTAAAVALIWFQFH
ncbi:MAG: divalent metal cation transporter [Chitinophagaceae bacterium]|nr:divalent metal cation transporter [Chitinophagaceae bacterium]